MPKVYNKRHGNIPKGAIYVGRPSKYGNPYKAGKDGTRQEVIQKYKVHALKEIQKDPEWITPLRGKDLVCWCHPLDCHADILIELANSKHPILFHETKGLNAEGQAIRERWARNVEHDCTLLESGPIYPKEGGQECPNCGEDNFRAVGDSKFECGNCDWYMEV